MARVMTTKYTPGYALISGTACAAGMAVIWTARPVVAAIIGFVWGVLLHTTLAQYY